MAMVSFLPALMVLLISCRVMASAVILSSLFFLDVLRLMVSHAIRPTTSAPKNPALNRNFRIAKHATPIIIDSNLPAHELFNYFTTII